MVEVLGLSLSLILLVVGTALCGSEAIAPGTHFAPIGFAFIVAGIVGLFLPGAAAPFVLAGLVLVTGVGSIVVYRRLGFYTGSSRGQTSSSSDLRGVHGYALERVTERSGQVKLESGGFNPTYAARTTSGTIEEDEEVVVVDPGGGNVVTVEATDGENAADRALERERVRERESRTDTESEADDTT